MYNAATAFLTSLWMTLLNGSAGESVPFVWVGLCFFGVAEARDKLLVCRLRSNRLPFR